MSKNILIMGKCPDKLFVKSLERMGIEVGVFDPQPGIPLIQQMEKWRAVEAILLFCTPDIDPQIQQLGSTLHFSRIQNKESGGLDIPVIPCIAGVDWTNDAIPFCLKGITGFDFNHGTPWPAIERWLGLESKDSL